MRSNGICLPSEKDGSVRIDYLKEFVTLGHTLSFGIAARQHYITEATLSKHIAAMESLVGAKLFVRDTHHVRLSAEGKAFLLDIEPLVEEYDFALARVRALSDSSYLLRVGFMADALGGLLPKALKWMGDHDPKANIQFSSVDYDELTSGLLTRRFNLILTMDVDDVLRRSCLFLKLGESAFCAVLSHDHPLSQRCSLSSEELARWPLLMPDAKRMPALHQKYKQILGAAGDDCTVAQYCNDTSSIILAAEAGIGVGLAPQFQERHYQNRMRFIPVEGSPTAVFDVGALWLRGKNEQLVAPFVEALKKVANLP